MDLKEQILEKTESLIMRYGIKSVTMDDLAREMGMSKKTLYQYIPNKTQMVQEIFKKKIEEEKCIMEEAQAQAVDAIDEILTIARWVIKDLREMSPTVIFDLQKYYREIWTMMESYHSKHILRKIRQNIERGIEEGVYRNDISADLISKLYVSKNASVASSELFPPGEYDLEELFKAHMIYHIRGIASPKGLQLFEKHLAARDGKID